MKLFEAFNQQLMLNNLEKVDESILKKYKINSFEEIRPYFDKYKLNLNNLYLSNNGIFPEVIYLDKYCSSKVILALDILDDEFLGLQRVTERLKIFKDMFEKEDYGLLFHNEFNEMALYHFLNLYKDINKEKVYDVFRNCYQSISYGFNLIPEEVLEYILQFKPTPEEVLKKINSSDGIDHIYKLDDYITIYRGQGTKSLDIRKAKSWTLSIKIAEKFATFGDGEIYEGQIKISDIIDYIDDSEYEVLVNFEDLVNVKII